VPILKAKISATGEVPATTDVAAMLQELTTRILGKKPEVTSILVEHVDPADWVVGGSTLRDQGKSSFYFDISITDETNTKDEKARYIREAFAGFAALLGDLHEESYIHIRDVRAAAYGYGGRTQEARYHLP
jgi:4-oxalocrotonate tautomerase